MEGNFWRHMFILRIVSTTTPTRTTTIIVNIIIIIIIIIIITVIIAEHRRLLSTPLGNVCGKRGGNQVRRSRPLVHHHVRFRNIRTNQQQWNQIPSRTRPPSQNHKRLPPRVSVPSSTHFHYTAVFQCHHFF